MELSRDIYNKIIELIDITKSDINFELEVRYKSIDEYAKFLKIFKKMTLSKDNNGMGFRYELGSSLDVYLKRVNKDIEHLRLTIDGQENIQKYWLTEKLDDIEYKIIEKDRKDMLTIADYNTNIAINSEIPDNEIIDKNRELLIANINNNNNTIINKYYRFKNRYTVYTDDNLYKIDFTCIKTGYGPTLKDSNTLKNIVSYEIELEYINNDDNKKISSDNIANKLLEYSTIILIEIEDNKYILKNSFKNKIVSSYKNIIGNEDKVFIAANPVTLHRRHLLKDKDKNNLYNRYAVTLKADGQRYLLYVFKSDDPSSNGKIFLLDINFNILDTGYVDESYAGSIIEGELIEYNNIKEFYCYDMLYNKGYDIRRSKLINIYGEVDSKGRLNYLESFIKSNSRKIDVNYTKEIVIEIKKKNYKFSVAKDGSDIFMKAKELWDQKNYVNFETDGLIFTPINEYYPLKSGVWYSLFKWKPAHLNTIDFLVKTLKYDNNNDIKSPYIENIKLPDGKYEQILKQYKTLQLYVGKLENKYDINSHKMVAKVVPSPFNPYNLDEKDAQLYNLCNVLLDESEKMSIINNNIKYELLDDIIIEFSYDDSKEVGFKWIPHRIRFDKTTAYKSGKKEYYGNMEKVANDVFRTIKFPITEEMILTGNVPLDNSDNAIDNNNSYFEFNNKKLRLPFQNFHNLYIKEYLYTYVSPAVNEEHKGMKGKIFDYCCGKGVDINKIKKGRYAEVVGMDFDMNNIRYAQDYYKNIVARPKPKAFYFRGDGGKLIFPNQECGFTEADKSQARKYIPTKYYFDVLSVQFAMHYFFMNEIYLRSFIQNLNDNLKIGGYFVGTCFDGERVYNLLKGGKKVEGKTYNGEVFWYIEKKYKTKLSFDDNKPNFDKSIDVFVKSIGKIHEENLVNFNYFNAIMTEYGFENIFIKPFSELYDELINNNDINNSNMKRNQGFALSMSDEEKKFSFLNNAYVYKKVKNSSDELYKKLMEKMDKSANSKEHT